MAEHERLGALLQGRVGSEAARLLAVPDLTEGGGVRWRDSEGAALQPLSALPLDAQTSLRESHASLTAVIDDVADQIATEGRAGETAAYLLRSALVTPDGYASLYAAGSQPVLVGWGHAVPGQAVPPPPTGAAASAPAAASLAAPVPGGSFNALWLVPLLLFLLLGWLVWLLLQPLEPVIVEKELPPPPIEDPVPAAEAELAALKQELAAAQMMLDDLAGLCRLIPPDPEPEEPPEPPEIVKVEPPKSPPRVIERPRVALPAEVPQVSELPPEVTELPTVPVKQPTLCEPGWSPTQRPEVMVTIDGSGSMKESFPGASSRIDAAKGAVTRVIANLHQDIKAGLVSFTDCDATSVPRKYSYPERPQLLARVRGISPTAGTSLANSIRRAGNAAKSVGPATVIVVSDGEDTCGGDPCAAARALKARKPLLKVNVIDLSGGRSAVLQCVASATGGRVFTPANAAQMNEEVQQASGQPDASQCHPGGAE